MTILDAGWVRDCFLNLTVHWQGSQKKYFPGSVNFVTTSTSTCLRHSHNLGSTLLATPASQLLLVLYIQNVQGYTKRWSQGLVNFVSALAYHFCLALPAKFTQPGNHLLAQPSTASPVLTSDIGARCSSRLPVPPGAAGAAGRVALAPLPVLPVLALPPAQDLSNFNLLAKKVVCKVVAWDEIRSRDQGTTFFFCSHALRQRPRHHLFFVATPWGTPNLTHKTRVSKALLFISQSDSIKTLVFWICLISGAQPFK